MGAVLSSHAPAGSPRDGLYSAEDERFLIECEAAAQAALRGDRTIPANAWSEDYFGPEPEFDTHPFLRPSGMTLATQHRILFETCMWQTMPASYAAGDGTPSRLVHSYVYAVLGKDPVLTSGRAGPMPIAVWVQLVALKSSSDALKARLARQYGLTSKGAGGARAWLNDPTMYASSLE